MSTSITNTTDGTLFTYTSRTNESFAQGWDKQADGTWTALTVSRSKSGFKTERGARGWFMRNASGGALKRMGLA